MTLLCATALGASAGFHWRSQAGLEAAQKSLGRMRVEESNHLQQEQGLAPVFPFHVSSFRCVSVPRLAEKEAPHGQTTIGVLGTVAQRCGPPSSHCWLPLGSFSSLSPPCLSSAAPCLAGLHLQKCSKQLVGL